MKLIRSKLPLATRLSRVLFSTVMVLTLLFAAAMYGLIYWFESVQFYDHIESDFNTQIIAHHEQPGGFSSKIEDTIYYKLPVGDVSGLPEQFRGYPDGRHELIGFEQAYHLLQKTDADWQHVMVVDQSEFERIELLTIGAVLVMVVLILVVSRIFSIRAARRLLKPIQRLADEVEELRADVSARVGIVGHYPNDELGSLAQAFDAYALHVSDLILREQSFTNHISHELRTPLMIQQSATDLLLEDKTLSDISRRQLVSIQHAIAQMNGQITEFLNIARAHKGASLSSRTATLSEAVRRQVNQWSDVAQQKGIELNFSDSSSDDIEVPEVMLGVVVNNVLRNAVTYTEQGRIDIVIEPQRLQVIDQGPGISYQNRSRLMNGENLAPDETLGFGLGFSIVKRICDDQGWRVALSENQPTGLIVTISLR